MSTRREAEKRPFELIEESFHLVRIAPPAAIVAYYLGSLPFLLALLYFWSDMSRSAFAEQRLIPGVLGLTGLFVWMKSWQSIYCGRLLAQLCGEAAPRGNFRSFLRTALYQTILQPAGLFILPVALLIMFPFGWAYNFFSAATVIHGTANPDLRAAFGRSWRQTTLWPQQNHYVITLMLLFAAFVFINILSALLAGPFLVKTLLGLESVFTRSPWATMNSTLLMAQLALTYLCLDPVMKAAYVLRCFYGESLHTGQDLRADLNSLRPSASGARAALLAGLITFTLIFPASPASTPGRASEPTSIPAPASSRVSSDGLDRSIERTIQKREYSWRVPPEPGDRAGVKDGSWLARFSRQLEKGIKAMGRWMEDLVKSIIDKLRSPGSRSGLGGVGFATAMEIAIILLIALLLGVILWMLLRLWHKRPHLDPALAVATPAGPDLTSEEVNPAELPEDGWVRMAREFLARGESRLALRAFYLASLSHLGDRHLLTLARFKSNRDYERELLRRAHALGGLPQLFSDNMTVFERVWYGQHAVTPELIDQFSANLERMKGPA